MTTNPKPVYQRILLKLSGEALAGKQGYGIDPAVTAAIAQDIKDIHNAGVQVGIVIGGGNILRGSQFKAKNKVVHEATAHYMGMMATIINGLALQDALESVGCQTRLMSAIKMDGVCEPYIRRRAHRHLEKGRIVILGAGTGGPFVTTDTAAALRSMELEADILMKATRVDGIPTWKTYVVVIIPMMRPVFITTLVIVTTGIVKVFDLIVAQTGGGPGIATEVPAKYVYDLMFQAQNLGQGFAASTMMLLTVMLVVIPWAMLEFGGSKKHG